jgi:hypothetical protein
VDQPSNAAWLKQSACSGLVAVLFSVWVTAPVLDRVTFETWRAAAIVVAMMIGAGGVAWTRSWPGITFAVAVGLLGSVVWLDFVIPSDAAPRHPALRSVYDTALVFSREVILFFAGACAGGLPVWLWLRSRGRNRW